MVKYYYDKYNTVVTNNFIEPQWHNDTATDASFIGARASFIWDSSTGTWTLTGATVQPNSSINAYDSYHTYTGNRLYRITAKEPGYSNNRIPCNRLYKDRSEAVNNPSYSRGVLTQSGLVAENGTYPVDGRHSDGYWYVRGGVANTAPTMPGAFTQPSGALEIGDSKVFTVGAASDAEGNLSKYIWEASINGGSYTKVGETITNNLTYTIPTATSLKMRVKAVDADGLESDYRESSSYTVQQPQYYYSRYSVVANTSYVAPASWSYKGERTSYFTGLSRSYTFNSSTNTFTSSGGSWAQSDMVTSGTVGYLITNGGRYIEQLRAQTTQNAGSSQTVVVYSKDAANSTAGTTTYSRGSLVQSNITAGYSAYPNDGRHTDNYWYVRGSRVSQSIAPPTAFTQPVPNKKFRPSETVSIAFGASSAPNIASYEVDYRYGTGTWTQLAYNNTLSRSLTITTNKDYKTLEIRVRAKNTNNVYSDYIYSEPFVIEHNLAPVVTLTNPSANVTLYENDTLQITGSASDADPNQSVTIYAQINSEQRIALGVGLSNAPITFNRQLTFKAGKLYDGDTLLTDSLLDGVPQTLRVWAQDGDGAQSTIVERTFYVVPNRVPQLSVDAVVPSGVIDADTFKISGTALDQDANSNVKVNYRINGANPIEIYDGTGGTWEFEVSLGQLQVGENLIVVEVIDNYSAKASKTIKLNKNEIKTPILQSTARYKIEPPKGHVKGVLLWIQRDVDLDLVAELSMTLQGEQEQYVTLTANHTAPVTAGIVEDEFYYEADEQKNNIILKLSTTRTNIEVNNKIHLISGVLE